jgi:aspartokinase
MLLGNCLEANEVILVKNTDGVLFIDSNLIHNAKLLKNNTSKSPEIQASPTKTQGCEFL